MSGAPQHEPIQTLLCAAGHDNVTLSFFDQLPSTSHWLKDQLAQYPEYLNNAPWLCAVDWQTSGAGRRGKQWDSEPGNITFSLMTRIASKPSALMGLSLVTGLAVAAALKTCCDLDVQLKWPNDVICHGAKLGGLLTEVQSTSSPDADSVVFTGVGLNVLHHPAQASLGIGAISLQDSGIDSVDRDRLLGSLAASVLTAHHLFLMEGWQAFAERWARHDFLFGREVTLHRSDRIETARASGVNEEGALIVTASGKSFPVYSGEVSVRPI